MNKREAAAVLRVSERTLTTWQALGMPYRAGGPGVEGDYDPVAIGAWARGRGLGALRANSPGIPEDLGALEPSERVSRLMRDLPRAMSDDQKFICMLSGDILGKLMSDALLPLCLWWMNAFSIDAPEALDHYALLTVLLMELNARRLGVDSDAIAYEICGLLELAGDDRARAIELLARAAAANKRDER